MTITQKLGTGLLLAGQLLASTTHAQTQRDLTELGMDLYQRANAPDALARMRKDLVDAPEAYLVSIDQPGALVLLDKRRVRVPALKYNVALHLLEVRDSTGSHVWPPGSLDGFYLGQGSEARHFRSRLVRTGSTQLDFVEVLTLANDSPVVLGLQHRYLHEDAQRDPVLHTEIRPARTEIGQTVVAGSGKKPKEPLRELMLNQRSITRLLVPFSNDVDSYAIKQHLGYTNLAQVLQMVEYYNQHLAK